VNFSWKADLLELLGDVFRSYDVGKGRELFEVLDSASKARKNIAKIE